MRVPVEISNPFEPSRSVKVDDALVDAGATRTTVSRAIARELNLTVRGQAQVRTAAGVPKVDRTFATVFIDGHESIGNIYISDDYPGVLIGVLTLEDLGLGVDPTKQRLIDVEQLLL
ncbi:MAG TPA: retroviral-like aspartic protease family protein [Dehalococcoidia bacterium]|nr:retroviral-like aspartic protease family protein [Dehalococcoidia bacterium]